MNNVRNPFVIGGYIAPQYFCDRKDETKELVRKIVNNNNVALISPRRMGKTGLIYHTFNQNEIKKECYTFFVDIYATGNLKEFVFRLGKEIFNTLKPKGKKFVEHFFDSISSLRPAFKLDPITGTPIFDIGVGEIEQPAFTLEEIFNYLEKADKHCVVAIDEFQQIATYPEKNIEAILRTHTQKCINSTFIFAGSQRHIMQNIFFSSFRPFYQSVALMNLGVIEQQQYTAFAKHHFDNGGKEITSDVMSYIYQTFEGHTWYIQNVLNELYSMTEIGERCSVELAQEALLNRLKTYEPLFENMMSMISERQKELLSAIAKQGKVTQITSAAFIKLNGLNSASSVQSSARMMLDKEIITVENGEYQVYDRFFGLWIKQQW